MGGGGGGGAVVAERRGDGDGVDDVDDADAVDGTLSRASSLLLPLPSSDVGCFDDAATTKTPFRVFSSRGLRAAAKEARRNGCGRDGAKCIFFKQND